MTRALRGLAAVALALVLLEAVVRVALSIGAVRSRLPGDSDTARRLQKTARAQASLARGGLEGLGLAPMVHDPQLGWRNRPGRHEGGGVRVTVGPAGHRVAGSGQGAHVAVFGDSFAFGAEVADEDTFAARLARETSLRITNAGVPGYGLDQVWLHARGSLLELEPDLVVVGITAVSMQRLRARWSAWQKPVVEPGPAGLVVVGVPVPSPAERVGRRRWGARTVDLLRLWGEVIAPPRDDWAGIAERAGPVVAAIEAEVEAAGADLLLAYLPQQEEYEEPLRDRSPPRRIWATLCERRRCVDLAPPFRTAWESGVELSLGAHWSAAGHEVAADALGAVLGE